jgi:predicted transcriptional regulator
MYKEFDLEVRRKIFVLISKNPGLNAKKISDILKISGQLADYHLLYLERHNFIQSVKEEGYRRFYKIGEMGKDERKKLSLLRQEIPLKIVLLLLEKYSLSHKELLSFFDIAPSTLSYHLKKLMKNDIVYYEIINSDKMFKIKDIKYVKGLLIKYKPYSWVDNFTDAWSDLSWE